jgi:hypothetical protein
VLDPQLCKFDQSDKSPGSEVSFSHLLVYTASQLVEQSTPNASAISDTAPWHRWEKDHCRNPKNLIEDIEATNI